MRYRSLGLDVQRDRTGTYLKDTDQCHSLGQAYKAQLGLKAVEDGWVPVRRFRIERSMRKKHNTPFLLSDADRSLWPTVKTT